MNAMTYKEWMRRCYDASRRMKVVVNCCMCNSTGVVKEVDPRVPSDKAWDYVECSCGQSWPKRIPTPQEMLNERLETYSKQISKKCKKVGEKK